MKGKILKLLKDNKEDFISGEKISQQLNVSRTSIWKYIKQLKEEGYNIESVSRKGYRLISSPDILTSEEITPYLNTEYIGRKILHFDSIDSTNIKAKEFAQRGEEEGTVIISEEQTKGRGRLGRSWASPKGEGIWMSIILKPNINPMDASKVTQIGAAAVCNSINEMGIDALIKWPNDIVLNRKKVCGILTEMSAELNIINYIVIGIGINANIRKFPEDIKDMATSLKLEIGNTISRKKLVGKILNNFEELYNELVNNNSISKSLNICRKKSILLGNKVKIISRNQEIIGKAIDITNEGELIIETENGKREKLISGEVSVRGLYGYV
ncbi:biotin--[acetyl-CoA-carboxylase] ligase [Thermohalobacter berrensis]|uniref:Bifunctional ligase/repressor BirA n=1 Tax=Thermohalobacter berrensis TaxID=99594 RepID=A0A419T8S0_9FIRM|nr:biotin--[acetyl-CoA-carboxylase] ligase [Thermohalobacter berrensis]RKD33869.1 biotin--[acetyl-CoA-carboxylase] ligase [Thermohalobacter berrensis]